MREDFDVEDVVDTTNPRQVPHAVMDDFEQKVHAYIRAKSQITALTTETGKLRKDILPKISEYGVESGGNFEMDLPESIQGVTSVVKQRRASKKMDDRETQRLLKSKGLYDQCTKTITVIDETAVMDALYDGEISDEDMDVMFPTKVTFALVMKK